MACGVETVTVISKRSGGRSVVKGRNPRYAPLITILGGVLTMMGQHSRKCCSTTSAWKIKFLRPTRCGSSKNTSALGLCRERLKASYSET
jgi:hypothetical protein